MEILLLNEQYFKKKSHKGIFISFEGGEGVGKSTQINLLKNYLSKINFKVVCTREPGGTEEGEFIRKFLVSGNRKAWDSYSETLLFNGIRREHINKVINPAIQSGHIVLCDRFIDSTIVYQSVAGKINKSLILELHKNFCYNLYPDITFFLNLDPKLGLKRASSRNNLNENRFESMGLNYHKKILAGFNGLQKKFKERIIKINAAQTIEKISENINSNINSFLLKND